MVDIKPIFCRLPTHHTNSDSFGRTFLPCSSPTYLKSSFSHHSDNTCFINNHRQFRHADIIASNQTKYTDVPKFSRISDKKRSNFNLQEKHKSNERIFKEEHVRSKPTTNRKDTMLRKSISSTRHIGSQTNYREESTQTDPFSPTYTISGGEHPEVFALSDFTYGKGLPATSLEISFIERLRARREWEQDHTIDMTRTKIVIEREIREWQIREKKIKMLQDAHHKLFTKNLHTYIENDEDLTQTIIDLTIYRQEKQLQVQHKRLETETSRDIRRIKRMYRLREAQINAVTRYDHLGVIGMSHRGSGCFSWLKPPWHTRPYDIITTFKNYTSNINTPCSYYDYVIDRPINQYGMNIFELEKSLPENALIAKIDKLDRFMIRQNNPGKNSNRRLRDLEKANQLIQEEKTKKLFVEEKKPFRFVEKIETVDHVKQTQIMPTETEAHDRRRIAIIKLQNYLRGIMVQSKISNVRQIRQHLLDELRSEVKHDPTSSMHMMNTNDSSTDQLASPRTQIYDYLEGATMSDMFDFLSKELVRLQCEQTIHLFILLADRYRYQREAAETGSRTKSIEQQKLENRAFQEMFSFDSNNDMDTYLQDLILQSISDTADEQARLEIKQLTETLTNLTDQMNNPKLNRSEIEMIVSKLAHQFLIPTVQRILTQQKSDQSQFTYLQASHQTCLDQFDKSCNHSN